MFYGYNVFLDSIMLAHERPSHPDVAHPHPLIRSISKTTRTQRGVVQKFPNSTSSQPICLPASLHFCFLSLPLAPLLCSTRPRHAVLVVARSDGRTSCQPRCRRCRQARREVGGDARQALPRVTGHVPVARSQHRSATLAMVLVQT
jgi:hypothetical protein